MDYPRVVLFFVPQKLKGLPLARITRPLRTTDQQITWLPQMQYAMRVLSILKFAAHCCTLILRYCFFFIFVTGIELLGGKPL